MCGTCVTADRLALLREGRLVADGLVAALAGEPGPGRIHLAKAIDVSSPRGFDRAVAILAAELRTIARASDAAAVREALAVLEVDWRATTPTERKRLVAAAMAAAGRVLSRSPERLGATFGDAATRVVRATREAVRRDQRLAITASFSALDRRVLRHVVESQGAFVRDEHGRRLEAFGREARRIVANGLEQGLGREAIAEALRGSAEAALVQRAPFYWEVVAGAFIGQSRSFAQMSSYAEARIERYRVEAVLDAQTTPTCRFLHGKVFAVGDALRRFERVEALADPTDIKREIPWVRDRLNPKTGEGRLVAGNGEHRVPVAEVSRASESGFRALVSDAELADIGIGFPPYHGLCRSTTIALV